MGSNKCVSQPVTLTNPTGKPTGHY